MCKRPRGGGGGFTNHDPLASRPSFFSLFLPSKPHYMQVSLAIRERKHKLGSGMQGFLHESERERETWWVGGGEQKGSREKGGLWVFRIDLNAFCAANTKQDTKKV